MGEEPEVTDADEAFEHVQKETPQELRSRQLHLALLPSVGVILPAEDHTLLFKGQQAMIGNGYAWV